MLVDTKKDIQIFSTENGKNDPEKTQRFPNEQYQQSPQNLCFSRFHFRIKRQPTFLHLRSNKKKSDLLMP